MYTERTNDERRSISSVPRYRPRPNGKNFISLYCEAKLSDMVVILIAIILPLVIMARFALPDSSRPFVFSYFEFVVIIVS